MTETLQLIFQIIQWAGSLSGLIGGIILIMKFFKERPILKIGKFLSTHYIHEDEKQTVFQIYLELDNIGNKPTTIKTIHFMIPRKEEKDSWSILEFEDFKMFHLNLRSSMKFLEKTILYGCFEENIEIEVNIDHTHGHIDKKIESVFGIVIPYDKDDEHY